MTQKQPKVTVVTATFNLIKDGREKFFRQCVESVHNQTYKNIEHLIMDGASTDGTLDLIMEYENKGYFRHYSEPDHGMQEAMNKGLLKATGDYIVFLNSDDFYHSNTIIERCIQQLLQTDADYLFADLEVIERNGKPFGFVPVCPIEYFFLQMPLNHEALIVKKSIYEKLGGYNVLYGTTIDYDFVCKLILNDCTYTYFNDAMLTVRLGGGTTDDIGKPRDCIIQTVTLLYKDMYRPICNLSDVDCKNMFLNHQFHPLFLDGLKDYLVKKNLKNFNYVRFFELVNSIKSDMTTQIRETKKIYLFYFIPLLKIIVKKKNIFYKLFNLIPLFKIRRK